MSRVNFHLDIELKTPLQIQAGFGRHGLHQGLVCNHEGAPLIPASSLKGRLRFQAQRFDHILSLHRNSARHKMAPATFLFGDPSHRGCLFLDQAQPLDEFKDLASLRDIRASIQVNCDTSTVNQGHLRLFEAVPAQFRFRCQASLVMPSGWTFPNAQPSNIDGLTTADWAVFYLHGAMHLCDRLGGGKTRGNGHIALVCNDWSFTKDTQEQAVWPDSARQAWFNAVLKRVLKGDCP